MIFLKMELNKNPIRNIVLFSILLIILLTFTIQLSQATTILNATTSSYNIEKFHQGSTGGNSTTSSYDGFRFTTTFQQPGNANGSTSSYFLNIGWFDVFRGRNETNATTNITTPPGGTSDGGGGRSSSGCNYEWVCTEWYVNPCPETGVQQRLCVNKGTCTGTTNMPETTKECNYEKPVGPLFDLYVNIPINKKAVLQGDKIVADIRLINIKDPELLDVYFRYWIVDKENKLIAEERDTIAVEKSLSFSKEIELPKDIKPGTYYFYTEIIYDEDKKTALASDSFWIVKNVFYKIMIELLYYMLLLLLIILIIYILHKIYSLIIRKRLREMLDKVLEQFRKSNRELKNEDMKSEPL